MPAIIESKTKQQKKVEKHYWRYAGANKPCTIQVFIPSSAHPLLRPDHSYLTLDLQQETIVQGKKRAPFWLVKCREFPELGGVGETQHKALGDFDMRLNQFTYKVTKRIDGVVEKR
jgi:hypothetical protein